MIKILKWFYYKMADYYFYKRFLGNHTEEDKLNAIDNYHKWNDKYIALK